MLTSSRTRGIHKAVAKFASQKRLDAFESCDILLD